MNTLRVLRYSHMTGLKGVDYHKRQHHINMMVLMFSKYLTDELLFYNGWVGYGKE